MQSLNNLTPEDHLLMAEKPELSKKCVELKQVCITPPHVEETRQHQEKLQTITEQAASHWCKSVSKNK